MAARKAKRKYTVRRQRTTRRKYTRRKRTFQCQIGGAAMKELKIILVVLMIALPIWGVYRYIENMSPVWEVTAAQQAAIDLQQRQAEALIDAQAHAQRAADWTDAQRVFLWVVVVGVGCGIGVTAWLHYDKRRESWARAVDGTFALQHFNQAGQVWTVDPNKQIFGVIGQDKRTGQITTDANIVGPDRQLTYVMNVQKTRTVSAGNSGDGIRYAAHAKLLAGAYDKPISHIPYEQLEAPDDLKELPSNWQPLSLVDAFNQSTPDKWLLGQNATGPCEFNLFDVVHTGLLGATKCGKTSSTALLMALNAAKHGMKVIALDGAGGVDWKPYSNVFEVYETDYTMIGDQLNQIVKLHDTRTKALKLAGVPNIDELDYQIPSLFVILEEFGRTMQSFKAANKKQYEATVTALSTLMRVSRKTGIYFLLIDQSMASWDQLIKPNIKDYISYHLGGNQGNAFNAYNLHELKPKGQFWNNGNVYDAWYTRGEVKPLLQNLPALRTKLLTDTQHTGYSQDAVTGYGKEGEGKAVLVPPQTVTVEPVTAPVTGGYTSDNRSDSVTGYSPVEPVTAPVTAVMEGKPVTAKDRDKIRNIYAMTQSKSETCRLVWGGKNGQRMAWVNEILQGESAQ